MHWKVDSSDDMTFSGHQHFREDISKQNWKHLFLICGVRRCLEAARRLGMFMSFCRLCWIHLTETFPRWSGCISLTSDAPRWWFLRNSRYSKSSVCLKGFGGRPHRNLVAGMAFWGWSRAAANNAITDDLGLLVRLQTFLWSHFLVSMQKFLPFLHHPSSFDP